MLSPRWRKVVRDLWGNRTRTILVILSIAVGVFAVGMVASNSVIFTRELNASWAAVNPASASLFTGHFDDELLYTVRNMPEVAEADARRSFTVRFKPGSVESNRETGPGQQPPAQPGQLQERWRNLQIFTYPDYDDIRIFQIDSERGAWPPPEQQILIERASLDWMGIDEGELITVEAPNGKLRELRVAGVVHDSTQMSATWIGQGASYVSADTLDWLGVSRDFDELNIIVAEKADDKEHINAVTAHVQDKVERSGREVYFTWIPTPGKHPADEVVQPITLLMGAMGMLSLLVSGFLVFNTLQALLTQQVRQIGIMKAIGGQANQIMGIYYAMVLLFGLLALAIAVPLGSLAGHAMTSFMAGLINFDVSSAEIPLQVFALEAVVGLVVPAVAALYPILSGVRTTAAKAMSDYGLGNSQFGQGFLDRLLERIRGLSRPVLLSLRNTFRRKGRLALTLTTLVLGGAIFIAVFSVRASLLTTLDSWFDLIDYDVYVTFRRGYRIDQLEREALNVPGVTAAEVWRFNSARRQRPDGTEGETMLLRAPKMHSDLIQPTIVEGRWLLPEDDNAIVLNTFMLKDEPDIGVGDEVELTMEGEDTLWRVVGIMEGMPFPMGYVNFDYLAKLVGGAGRGGVVFVQTERHDPAYLIQMEKTMEEHFEDIGLNVNSTMTSTTERGQVETQFNVLVIFLLIMAVLLAVVGGIGLMGTMSLNVLERTREIGVMRAIGASDGAVLQVVIVEGVLIGLMSWLIAVLLALPLSKVLSDAVGISILQAQLRFTFSTGGTITWFVIALILSALASFWPARNASRVTVREVLAYE
jgi:putative ABC transport system permease protein